MQTIQPALSLQERNRVRHPRLGQSSSNDVKRQIDKVALGGKDDELGSESISKLLAVPASQTTRHLRSRIKLDLFKSAMVAAVASIVATGLQFVSMESVGGYLFGIAFTSYLSLHSLDHHSKARPSSN